MAREKVRYFGEPIAIVVANSKEEAARAITLIKVKYKPLPLVNSISEAIKPDTPLIHEELGNYVCAT